MFKNNIFTDYTGAQATGEIIIMLLGAAILGAALGYLLRYFLNEQYGCQHCEEFELEEELRKMNLSEEVVLDTDVQKKASVVPSKYKQDDLKVVEGIGPKIASLMVSNGITTWKELARADTAQLQSILLSGGDRFRMHDPSSWPTQAGLAAEGKWDELSDYQDFLNGGKAVS